MNHLAVCKVLALGKFHIIIINQLFDQLLDQLPVTCMFPALLDCFVCVRMSVC